MVPERVEITGSELAGNKKCELVNDPCVVRNHSQ